MELSKFLLQTTSLTLDALFKASDADIRLHNIENIPENQPVLFVVNHFTRLETTFLPYMIHKKTGIYALSLAHYSFFGGKFGKILEKVGAISTKHPDRDKIFYKSLLDGKVYSIIFPEGQMVKDKKLIEKGKFMVYNMGIRRPPHTGASRLALRAQFYREKLQYFYEKGYQEELKSYIDFFDLEEENIADIIHKETFIVPVNITYYPIRAKNNAIKRFVEKFIKNISDRFEEELEVEGTMIMEGVDIDINFGKAISIKNSLNRNKKVIQKITNTKLYLDKRDLSKDIPFTKLSSEITQAYMHSIYAMTTVNHDHIFSFLLASYKKSRINETDFKNRANIAINNIKKLNLANFHTTLKRKQSSLQTDDFNYKYNTFIEAALSDKLITFNRGFITKKRTKFSMPYQFHSIRKDNIVEVLKNEIEPMESLVKMLKSVKRMPSWMVRRNVKNTFLKLDTELFKADYKQHFIPDESKPTNIGEPFFLKRPCSSRGVILVHGYMAAPEEIRPLADYLYKKGYTVYGARLRGHGTAPEDLAERHWEEWYDSVNRAYVIMKNSVKNFAIIGFSTGAGLALLQGANKGEKIAAIVSINAPLRLQNISSKFSSAIVFWNKLLERINVEKAKFDFVKNNPENEHINYFRNPISGVKQLGDLMNHVEGKLSDITIPALILQGDNDPVVNPASGHEIYEKISSEDKKFFEISSNRHGILRGKESEVVFRKVEQFLRRVMN